MAQSAQKIDWLNAPPVPVEVMQMLQAGKQPAGEIIDGPNGQTTYRGPIRTRVTHDNSWRDDLKELPGSS